MTGEEKITRHGYLLMKLCMDGSNVFVALESIASVAIEHPEWDLGELKTWNEWESE